MVVPLAVVQVHKSHAAFHEPPSHQAIGAHGRLARLRSVERERLGRFAGKISQLRHAGLHSEGKLILLDSGHDLWIGNRCKAMLLQSSDRVDEIPLVRGRHAGHIIDIVHR